MPIYEDTSSMHL